MTAPTVVALPADLCPACGRATDTEVIHEPALIRHGGYGATRRTTTRHCTCGWSLHRETTETSP